MPAFRIVFFVLTASVILFLCLMFFWFSTFVQFQVDSNIEGLIIKTDIQNKINRINFLKKAEINKIKEIHILDQDIVFNSKIQRVTIHFVADVQPLVLATGQEKNELLATYGFQYNEQNREVEVKIQIVDYMIKNIYSRDGGEGVDKLVNEYAFIVLSNLGGYHVPIEVIKKQWVQQPIIGARYVPSN